VTVSHGVTLIYNGEILESVIHELEDHNI